MSRRFTLSAIFLLFSVAAIVALRRGAQTSLPPPTSDGRPATGTAAYQPEEVGGARVVDTVTPDPAHDLHGVVVGRDGTPIPGTRLRALAAPFLKGTGGDPQLRPPREVASDRSAPDGTFRLGLRAGQVVTLRAEAPGYAPREIPGCLAGRRVRVELSAGVRVTAVVTTRAGDPVPGARVALRSTEIDLDQERVQEGRTDALGKAEFDAIQVPTHVNVAAWHATAGVGRASADLQTDGAVRVDVELQPTRTVRGRVTEAATGAPIAGALVRMARFPGESTRTGADGRYELAGVSCPPEPDPESRETDCYGDGGTLVAEARGFCADRQEPDAEGIADFALEREARVTGRVVDPAGVPVAGASVQAARSGPVPLVSQATESDGKFGIDGLAGNTVYLLLVHADGFGLVQLEFEAPAAGESLDLGDIRLGAAGRIAGRVLSADGEPVSGVRVTLDGAVADRCRLRPGQPTESEPSQDARTDDLGRFSFPELAAGGWTVSASGECTSATAEVALAEGAVVELELRLPPVLRLRVLVTDSAGVPQAGVNVEGSHGGNGRGYMGTSTRKPTDAEGVVSFVLGTVRPSVRVHSGPPGWEFVPPAPIEVAPGATEVRIIVVPGLRTGGIVVDESGAPVAGAQVAISRGDEDLGAVFADADGKFSVLVTDGTLLDMALTGEIFITDPFRRETQLLLGSLSGVRPGDRDLRLPAVRPPRDTRLILRIVGPGNVPAAGVTVKLSGPGIREEGTSAPDGSLSIDGLPRVPLRLTLLPPDGSGLCWWAGAVTPSGQEQRFELARELRFTGRVLRPDGSPAQAVRVEVHVGGRWLDWNWTEDDGSFVLSIPEGTAGPYTFVSWNDDDDTAARVEMSKAGEPVTIQLGPRE